MFYTQLNKKTHLFSPSILISLIVIEDLSNFTDLKQKNNIELLKCLDWEELKKKVLTLNTQKNIRQLVNSFTNENPIQDKQLNNQIIKVYLRKYSYKYQLLKLKQYPNNLSLLSQTKINKLAIVCLFILNGI